MMTRSVSIVGWRVATWVVVATLVGGCSARAPRSQRFVQRGAESASEGAAKGPAKDDTSLAGDPIRGLPKESLSSFIERTRQLAAAARPPEALRTIERQDAGLSSAQLILAVHPVAESHRRVAEAYARLGVLDAAYDHFKAALRLEPADAASFDGLARIWRDWGLSHLGLGDAHRAIYYAPASPAAYNTLGTILHRLGQTAGAQSAFEAALRRDPNAAYALNNLCYVHFLQEHFAEAIAACGRALSVQPDLTAARNNLGLAYWAKGDRRSAVEAFASTSDPGAARYNTGIALLGSRMYWQAAQAFDEAGTLSPALPRAHQRARQARTLVARVIDVDGGVEVH